MSVNLGGLDHILDKGMVVYNMKNSTKILKKLTDEFGQFIIPHGAWDHYKKMGNEFIAEPYSISKQDLKQLIQICDSKGIDFYISGDSTWYPGQTFKITYILKETQE